MISKAEEELYGGGSEAGNSGGCGRKALNGLKMAYKKRLKKSEQSLFGCEIRMFNDFVIEHCRILGYNEIYNNYTRRNDNAGGNRRGRSWNLLYYIFCLYSVVEYRTTI